MKRTIQQQWIRDASKALLLTMPRVSLWPIDEQMVALKAQYKGKSVVYGLCPGQGYNATSVNSHKYGCTYDFHKRMCQYRFDVSAVVVVPTPFPHAAEVVLHYLFQNSRLFALETVEASPELLKAALDHAVRCVAVAVADMGHTAPATTHRAYDHCLCKHMNELLSNEGPPTPIKAPEDTPLSPYDCVELGKAEAKRQQEEQRTTVEAKRAINPIGKFIKDTCVLEQFRVVDASGGDCAKVRTFTPVAALFKAYGEWLDENQNTDHDVVRNSKHFGCLLTPIVGATKQYRLNKEVEPKDTWGLWGNQALVNKSKQVTGRFGIRFKATPELNTMEE